MKLLSPQQLLLGLILGLVLALLLPALGGRQRPPGFAEVRVSTVDPYESEVLEPYGRFRDAVAAGDTATLAELASGRDFLAYRAALTLARDPALAPAARLGHYQRMLVLRLDDPLARSERRSLHLEMARVAEAAGDAAVAVASYREALPEDEAVEALKRLQTNPYRLANSFLQDRLNRLALEALGGLTAPSIEAPAHRALGEYGPALDAYERWLQEQPGNLDARFGQAWSTYYLGDLDAADSLFAALPGSNALYGRAIIANRQGNLDRAVTLLTQTGEARWLWLATGLLEARDRYQEALPIYLRLARGGSSYADDAAYRALVLAGRLGEGVAAAEAEALVPAGSFFGLKLGKGVVVPEGSTLDDVSPAALELARALIFVNDPEAAVGELLFALRQADTEPETVAIGEMLQSLGEFHRSQRAAQRFVSAGSREARTWRLAYPGAYPELVVREATGQDLEPELLWAIMRQESLFFPTAVSHTNAKGLMQVIPSTWNWLADLQNEPPGDPFDPADNIRYGAYYLGFLMNYLDDDPELVVSSYNRGQGYIKRLFEGPVVGQDKDELYREIDAFGTREYLQRVMVNYEIYKALYRQED